MMAKRVSSGSTVAMGEACRSCWASSESARHRLGPDHQKARHRKGTGLCHSESTVLGERVAACAPDDHVIEDRDADTGQGLLQRLGQADVGLAGLGNA